MCALRIEFMKLDEALRCDADSKSATLDAGIQHIVAQNIVDLERGARLELQCVVWFNGPPKAIETLKGFLAAERIIFEEH